jgi:3-isopropylmalate/(R)-2-methylmalate dehydratase small subunit
MPIRAFTRHEGLAAPLDRANVDTDQIIPKQFLKSLRKSGFGPNLFDEWRYIDPQLPGQDSSQRRPNPNFVLNQARYKGASILVTRDNFGCGSSREHAVWALAEFGMHAIIAPSFAEIFSDNCLKNGVLPVVLERAAVERLLALVQAVQACRIVVDLQDRTVRSPDGQVEAFRIDEFRRECLLNGWDDIGLTLRHAELIRAFESQRLERCPWLTAAGSIGV